ncbi:hypothetical protein CMI37_29535 [Candidatus Pacearchaeota archaeon]|nr:hypothetical protein [Candidatus Pacearchaeota archaeon]
MSLRKFGPNDININTMKAHPPSEFFIYDGHVYYNNVPHISGTFSSGSNITLLNTGFISLYEYNISRTPLHFIDLPSGLYKTPAARTAGFTDPGSNPIIYPYLTKDSARASFKTAGHIPDVLYNNEFQYGDVLSGTYPQYASITREYITNPSASYNMHFWSLKNTLNLYGVQSRHYLVSSSLGNKNTQPLNLIHIPSIFYGTEIKPGTVSLRWYFTGSLIGELQDSKENGELIQVGPAASVGSGSVGGVVLYNEGFILLTGSWNLNEEQIFLLSSSGGSPVAAYPEWLYFGAGANDGLPVDDTWRTATPGGGGLASASFGLTFQGTTKTQTVTMYTHAKRGQVNYSNNLTFLMSGSEKLEYTSSHVYEENSNRLLANTVSSSYTDYSASFKRQVYISKVGIYDVNKNLIGVATLSNPVKKEEDEDLSFKIKLDI